MRAAVITAIAGAILLTGCFAPKRWPIPQLSVPSGAPPARIPDQMVPAEAKSFLSADKSMIKEGPNVYSWMRGFNYSLGWDSLVRHVEGSISPLGYTAYKGTKLPAVPSIPGVPDGTLMRAWISPDGKYLVAMINIAFIKSRDQSYQFEGDADYVLAIDQMKDLPPALQKKYDSGGI